MSATATATAADRRDHRILTLIAAGEAVVEDADAATLRVAGPEGLRRLRLDPVRLAGWISDGVLAVEGDPPRALRLTAAGRARLRRSASRPEVDGFRLQHGDIADRRADQATVLVDHAESPLTRLARRRDRGGRAYLSPSRVAAGERLRADFTLGRMMPALTSNWSIGRVQGGRGGGLADLTDRAVAARDRVEAALAAVGADLGGVLIDVCCFLKGLETVESERRWPVRSAKVVLDIALGRLADHYGLADEARGGERGGRPRAWGTPDHRPNERRAPLTEV
jgi:hypothetical protein